jgi:predicted RNA binding protein YcfA (HicA-like mRNA interferase family)
MDSRTVLKLLLADGWYRVNQVGSHIQLKHPVRPGRVTLVHPKRDIPIGTLRSIEKQSGIRFGEKDR